MTAYSRTSAARATLLLVASAAVACIPASQPGTPQSAPSARPTTEQTTQPSPDASPVAPGWRQLPATGPAPMPREDHTWTLDGDGEVAYLFGGRDDASGYGSHADLWAYDLAADTWQQLSGGPPARFGHNAAWVPGVGLVIFAGQDVAFYNDLWAYDPASNSWRALPASGAVPVPRYGSCAALGPDGRLWISHGFTSEGSRFADTRAYDFLTETWVEETPVGVAPIVRCLHACWWTSTDHFALYGGQTTGVTSLGDRWELTVGPRPGTNAWREVAPESPEPSPPAARNLYASTRWGERGTLVFGGQAVDGTYLPDTWLLDDRGTHSELPYMGPSPRSGAELVADSGRGRVLMFGGKAGASVFGDLWELTFP